MHSVGIPVKGLHASESFKLSVPILPEARLKADSWEQVFCWQTCQQEDPAALRVSFLPIAHYDIDCVSAALCSGNNKIPTWKIFNFTIALHRVVCRDGWNCVEFLAKHLVTR